MIPIVVDFETMPIAGRPNYPPEPVGVAIKWPDEPSEYFGWGHPSGNNCCPAEGMKRLHEVWGSGQPVLFHHAKFDMAVAYEKLGLQKLPWWRVHDTMFLAYLQNPHSRRLDLKGLAEDLLGEPPAERDDLHDWIWEHRREVSAASGFNVVKTKLGAHIAWAPCDLVGRYAIGDVERTWGIYRELMPEIAAQGMGAAYDRERQLLPILMENEEIGMRMDMEGLNTDIFNYSIDLQAAEEWLRGELQASGLSFDNDVDVANVLEARGVVPEEMWVLTEKSRQKSMAKDALRPEMFTGPNGAAIASALGYRNRLTTCLRMFMEPWLEQGSKRGGYVSTNWNQTRGSEKGGTRTGRPSTSDPNFLNISKTFEGRDDGYTHPTFLDVSPLPLVRRYVLPDPGETLLHRDFSGQELRVFAHYERGDLWRMYRDDPSLDPHEWVRSKMYAITGRNVERTKVKVLNFQSLYGGGAPAAAKQLRCSLAEAREYKSFHNRALPGREKLVKEIRSLVRRGLPIRTWGGRLYYCEPPGPDGRSKDYKLINYVTQGSAADITKQTIIDWHGHPARTARFLVTVYDEINASADNVCGEHLRQMAILRECMEAQRLSVPMLSDGKMGQTWGDLEVCE